MTNYRVQNGCQNCRHVFVWYDHDSNDALYCMLNAPPRPKCGSAAMDGDEMLDWNKYEEMANAWFEWSKDRDVDPSGICDRFEEQPK